MRTLTEDYSRVERAIVFLEKNFREQPELWQVARKVGLSPFHFQRLFKRWAGISPKRFLQFLTLGYAKKLLKESGNLLDASYELGLSGPSRLHDLFVNVEAVTPGEFKRDGEGTKIRYGFHPSPFGECLLSVTDRGICGLVFVPSGDRRAALQDLKRRWKQAELTESPEATGPYIQRIFGPATRKAAAPLSLCLRGTNFQVKVWNALLETAMGSMVSYEGLARRIGRPRATRAVAQAVGQNPIAYLIPCHRVIRKIGAVGGYRWGPTRKKAMLGWESAQKLSRAGDVRIAS